MTFSSFLVCNFLVSVYFHNVSCQSTDHVRNILHEIFENKKYDKRVRPSKDMSRAVHVSIALAISGINFLDEKAGVFSVTGYLEIKWRDEFLVWQPELHGNVTSFTIPQEHIWIPDLFLKNGDKEPKGLGGSFYYLPVNHTGEVTWWPYQVVETHCPVDITYFPFDTQNCRISFSLWNHENTLVNITSARKHVGNFHFTENGIWTITANHSFVDREAVENYSQFVITFSLQRKSQFYLWNFIVLLLLLGMIKIFAFLIPAESGEKVSFTVTLFLTFGVFLNWLSSYLPENSDSVCLICVYMEIQLALGVFLVFIASMQVKISHRLGFSRFELRLIKLFSRDCVVDCSKKEKECATNWTILSSAIDKLMIIITTAVELFLILIFFMILCLGG
ncbi:acetylcholine receptor subunit beta-like [Crassostrea virginica]